VFHCVTIFMMRNFFLEPRPTLNLEDQPLSDVRECLFNVFATVLHIWRPFLYLHSEDLPFGGDRSAHITAVVIDILKAIFSQEGSFVQFSNYY